MAFITEHKLASVVDLPIALPTTELKMADWIVIASVKLVAPQTLTCLFLQLELLAASVDTDRITNLNKIFGNLGLAYVVLRKNYVSGSPGEAGALDVVKLDVAGSIQRTGIPVVLTEDGTYSWIVANNMQPSSDAESLIPASTSIDFKLNVTGQARLEINGS